MIKTYNDNHTVSQKVGIEMNYSKLEGKKKMDSEEDVVMVETARPSILKNVKKPIFKKAEFDFDEESIFIKHQLIDEDAASSKTKTALMK